MLVEELKAAVKDRLFPVSEEVVEKDWLEKSIEAATNTHNSHKEFIQTHTLEETEAEIRKNVPGIDDETLETDMDHWRKVKNYTEEDWDRELNERIDKTKESFEEYKKTDDWKEYVKETRKVFRQEQLAEMIWKERHAQKTQEESKTM